MADEKDDKKKKWEIGGLFIPAGLFIGMGIGWSMGHLTEGLFIGLGCGFAFLAIARLIFS